MFFNPSKDMNITKANLANIDLKSKVQPLLKDYALDHDELFGVPGQQHYTLLAYLSSLVAGSTIIDIGTHRGASALSLSTCEKTTIYSFDIQRKVFLRDLPNVNYELADLWDDTVFEYWKPTIMNSSIILLDVDPHNGTMEYDFYLKLKKIGYQGLLVCDDIWYFKEMRDKFWHLIPSNEKVDITALGHWSGTGVISFRERPDIIWETYAGPRTIGAVPEPSYTVVTAYFDLTAMPDASNAIKARPKDYYLQHARATLALDVPLVVYCEPSNLDSLRALRPTYLLRKTEFITVDFETLPMTQYRHKIRKNRVEKPYKGDERNTASYYLLCMARYALLKRTMDANPFKTENFAWLNICIERMGYTNLVHLDSVFSGPVKRERVSTAYIDYIGATELVPAQKYYEFGRCSLCSGFFTGSKPYLYEFCNRIEEKFLYYLGLGYGHADEQLFSPVYFDAPHLFDLYYGDYSSMITNYAYAYESKMPLNYVIPKSFAKRDWTTCIKACNHMWTSLTLEKCKITDEERVKFLTMYVRCAFELNDTDVKKNGVLKAFFKSFRPRLS
jgi:hypothetical protein